MLPLYRFLISQVMPYDLNPCLRTVFINLLKITGSILLFFLTGTLTFSQPVNIRPKIGLALSGGGAKGMAHVGVLKVMEEAGLRPDYISGVSMGSIIGGMYAIGYSADSIHKILNSMNWDLSFTSIIPENKVIFPEKEHYNNSIISLPISSKRVKLPSGLINGQQIENQMSYYSWPAAGINDFSKLPIPFMCLATDILTGKIVELKTGYLPDALRASSAVPTLFTPVRIDTAILIDGGVLRNYAAEEVIEMGADFVIGSYTGFQVYSEEQLQSMPGIVRQLVFMNSREDFLKQKKLTDVMIEPVLRGYSSTVFTYVDSIIERGYKAALPYKEYFRRLADSINRTGVAKPAENILDRQFHSFDKIEVTGNKLYSDSQILGVLGIEPGKKIDKKSLSDRIDLLYGKTWFEKVKYRIMSRNDSLILSIECSEESNSMLYGGIYYDRYIRTGLVFRITFKDLISPKSLLDFDTFIGQYYRFRLTLLKFIDRNQKFGISTVLYSDNTHLPMLTFRNETGSIYDRTFYSRFSISKYLGLNHLMNASIIVENNTFIPDFVSRNHLKKLTYNFLTACYDYQVNTLDKKNFPDRGTLSYISAGTSKLLSGVIRTDYAKDTYRKADPGEFSFGRSYSFTGGVRSYFSVSKDLTISLKANLLYTIDADSTTSLYNTYYLGGVDVLAGKSIPLAGFHSNEIAVDKCAGIGADFDLEVMKNVHLTLMTDFFAANEIHDNEKFSLLAGYGLEAAYMSMFGPVRIGFMHGLSSNERYYNAVKGYISIGYKF